MISIQLLCYARDISRKTVYMSPRKLYCRCTNLDSWILLVNSESKRNFVHPRLHHREPSWSSRPVVGETQYGFLWTSLWRRPTLRTATNFCVWSVPENWGAFTRTVSIIFPFYHAQNAITNGWRFFSLMRQLFCKLYMKCRVEISSKYLYLVSRNFMTLLVWLSA